MIASIMLGMLFLGIPFFLFAVVTFIFWVWMLIDCVTNDRLSGSDKIVWVLVLIFLNGLGALIYFFVGRKK